MEQKKRQSDSESVARKFFSFSFIFVLTSSMLSSGVFGLFPGNSITESYRRVIIENIPSSYIAPFNDLLYLFGATPITGTGSAGEETPAPLDPAGWILSQLGVPVPPLGNKNQAGAGFDPAGDLLSWLGVDVDSPPASSPPLDPAGYLLKLFGVHVGSSHGAYAPLDPGGALLILVGVDVDPLPVALKPLDPGGLVLLKFFPDINNTPLTPREPLDPVGMFMFLFFRPTEQPVLTPMPTATPTLTPLPQPSATASPSVTPSVSPSMTVSPSPTATMTWIVVAPVFTATPTVKFTPTKTLTPTRTNTATPTPITNWIVQSVSDDGTAVPGNCPGAGCRLRDALAAASAGTTVSFDPALSGQTIQLVSTLTIAKNLTIDGSSLASAITISGNNVVRVFTVNNVVATIKSLRVVNAYIPTGEGAGLINNGTLMLTNVTFDSNVSGGQGGGLTNLGTLTVVDSTFSNNSVTYCGAGINNVGTLTVKSSTFITNDAGLCGGAISGGNPYTVINSTFYNNSASGNTGGGALFNNSAGGITVMNSTFYGNAAYGGSGGGISLESPSGVLNISNTIVANSTAGGDCYIAGSLGTANNNLVSGTLACGLVDGTNGNIVGSDPNLGSLNDWGGPTYTMPLQAGSPAVDAGDDSYCPATDQRGIARPQGLHCDIGAYESSFVNDLIAPTVTNFNVTSLSTSLNIPITTFTASDNVGVTGYLVTHSAAAPLASDPGWTVTAPATYTVPASGTYTLYPWAKDAGGKVSSEYGSPITVVVARLVLHWNFEEGPGSCSVFDQGYSNLSGSLVNMDCSTAWSSDVPPGAGQSYSLYFGGFDGTAGDYVTSATSTLLPSGNNPRTLCAWAKSADGSLSNAAEHLVNYGLTGGGQAFGFMIFIGNTWWSYGQGADLNTGILADTGWHHHCVTYDGATVVYYFDGSQVASGSMSLNTTANTPMIIGVRPDFWTDRFFDGWIDDVRLYDYVLGPAEINTIP